MLAKPAHVPPAKPFHDPDGTNCYYTCSLRKGCAGNGPGGEGPEHHALKEYVFEHPEVLGLLPAYKKMEYAFDSGDRVDIFFQAADGTTTVVEIEVDGYDATRIGTLQAIKYRALAAAEAGNPLLGDGSQAVLVAHTIPSRVIDFAGKYGVRCHQLRPAQAGAPPREKLPARLRK